MTAPKNSISGWAARALNFVGSAGRAPRLGTRDALTGFLAGRAAQIAQTTLYTYLKTRMGTQFATLFQDEVFAPAIVTARRDVFEGCLADLTVYALSAVSGAAHWDCDLTRRIATGCFHQAYGRAMEGAEDGSDQAGALQRFTDRANGETWQIRDDLYEAFRLSSERLVAAVPVIDAYRDEDREILTNSMRFRWPEICREFRARVDYAELARDLEATDSAR